MRYLKVLVHTPSDMPMDCYLRLPLYLYHDTLPVVQFFMTSRAPTYLIYGTIQRQNVKSFQSLRDKVSFNGSRSTKDIVARRKIYKMERQKQTPQYEKIDRKGP